MTRTTTKKARCESPLQVELVGYAPERSPTAALASDSVHLDVESRSPRKFLGALDGQQLLVVEGSGGEGGEGGELESPGVLLPGDSAPGLCQKKIPRMLQKTPCECPRLTKNNNQVL